MTVGLLDRRRFFSVGAGALAALALPPVGTESAGRLKGSSLRRDHDWQNFVFDGRFRARSGEEFTLAGAVVPPVENVLGLAQWIVGRDDGRLEVVREPPDPETGAALIAAVDPCGMPPGFIAWARTTRAHDAWLTLYPPVDDPEAQARRRAYVTAGGIPGIHHEVGLPSTIDRTTLRSMRLEPEWDQAASVVRIRTPGRVFEDMTLAGALIYIQAMNEAESHGRITIRRCLFEPHARGTGLPAAIMQLGPELARRGIGIEDDALINHARSHMLAEVVFEDSSVEAPTTLRNTPRGLLFYARQHVRNCRFDGVLSMTETTSLGSTYEDVLVVNNGFGLGADLDNQADDDHANTAIVQSFLPYARRDEMGRLVSGYSRWQRFNLDQPTPLSARYRGPPSGNSTACLSFWGSPNGVREQGHVFEHGRIAGGTFCVDLNTYRHGRTPYIGDLTFRNIAFTREHSLDGSLHRLVNIRNTVSWGNLRFEGCFWEDTGELIDDLNGVWNPGTQQTTGRGAIRTPLSSAH